MICKYCAQPMSDTEQVCRYCGNVVPDIPSPSAPSVSAYAETALPREYRPLSPWTYFGLQVLFAIPLVGFIFLLIYTFKSDNIHRRNFARSYWCGLLIAGGILLLVAIATVIIFAIYGAQAMNFIPQ